jgi:pimeloyl-ACP methyl ester carboxylesterase
VWGERDLTLKPASFPRLVQSLADADGIPVADTGHQPHISKPAQVNSSVLEFIQQDRLQ